ncbi:T9SS type A sorting domain-containing protein [Mariniflexile sp.]|uniref:T9SS type A sorting domain-containing protein n=1 Tax=Mariniflexile sp. TaxID=1979402 RepID=UPI0040472B63
MKSNKVISSLTLFDLTGKKVLDIQKVIDNQVSIGKLVSGTYLMLIKDSDENTVVKKVVV